MPFRNPDTAKLNTYQSIKARIHKRLIQIMDLSNIDLIDKDVLKREIGHAVETLIEQDGLPLSQGEKDSLIVDIQHETFGLGPLEHLLADPDISDILVNRYNQVFVEKAGKLQKADVIFRD